MIGVDLRNAKLEEAKLEGAELGYSLLTGANFSSARLEKADLTGGVQAQGAIFLIASMQGADLTGAQLQAADLSSANLQGASLSYAHLEAATLRDADLSAASLNRAHLEGADLTNAKITGADFRGASVWMTRPPEVDALGIADFSELAINPVTETDVSTLKNEIDRIRSRRLKATIAEKLAPLMNVAEAAKWGSDPELATWQSLASASATLQPETFKFQITDYLAKLQCKARWGNGSVATGIARRAQAQQFRGDVVAIYDRLIAEDCPSSKLVPAKILRDLAGAADGARP
jgi:hypothetical protein